MKPLLLAASLYVFADNLYADTPKFPDLIGLLEIPSLYDTQLQDHTLEMPLRIRAFPSPESKSLGSVNRPDALESHEWSYEQPAAAVYGYQHDGQTSWYQVRMLPSGQTGWMSATTDTVFHPLSALISESLPYLTGAWNGQVYGTAGDQSTVTRIKLHGPEAPVAVAGSAMLKNKLWLLVVVLQESPCASADAPGVLQAGWIPAHSEAGDLNIWFYSRGC